MKPNVDYVFLGTCKGYLNHKEELSVDTSSVSQEYVLQFPLASIENPVLIRNIFYEFDSAALLESSCLALDSLVDLLNENPNVTIELSSHCDFRGKDEYNEKLSQRRAESVVNYLITHGIDTLRLTPKGYGEKRPKIVTRKIAATYDFLNEGDTLTEAFILALDNEEKQEICHALNRRTEFKVLRTTYKLFDSEKKPQESEQAPSAGGKEEIEKELDEAGQAATQGGSEAVASEKEPEVKAGKEPEPKEKKQVAEKVQRPRDEKQRPTGPREKQSDAKQGEGPIKKEIGKKSENATKESPQKIGEPEIDKEKEKEQE